AGLKVPDALHLAGMDVCIVEKEPSVLPLSVHPDCGSLIERHVREQGHELRLGVTIEVEEGRLVARLGDAVSRDGAGNASAPSVAQADLLVVCTGARANLAFLA